jgi:GcrA cell cycle regulator
VHLRKRPWTQEDDEWLRAFVAQGASAVRVAAALKRNTMSVRYQARKIGSPFPPLRIARQKWADTPNP